MYHDNNERCEAYNVRINFFTVKNYESMQGAFGNNSIIRMYKAGFRIMNIKNVSSLSENRTRLDMTVNHNIVINHH